MPEAAKAPKSRNLPLFTDEELEERWPVIRSGIEQFNDGFFFEAHETWEDVWLQSPMPARRFLQGMIQTAAAFVHLARHEYPGTVRLLGHAVAKLDDAPDVFLGIDTARLAADALRCREELLALGPERFEEWERARIPAIRLVTSS